MKIAMLPLWLPKFMFLNRTYVIANYVNNYIEKEDFTDLCEIVSITDSPAETPILEIELLYIVGS
jgi:hypothetical protein